MVPTEHKSKTLHIVDVLFFLKKELQNNRTLELGFVFQTILFFLWSEQGQLSVTCRATFLANSGTENPSCSMYLVSDMISVNCGSKSTKYFSCTPVKQKWKVNIHRILTTCFHWSPRKNWGNIYLKKLDLKNGYPVINLVLKNFFQIETLHELLLIEISDM